MAQKTDFIVERGLQVNTQITVANTLIISANGFQLDGQTVFDANGVVSFTNLKDLPDPTISVSLSGDLSGSGSTTLTDLANGSISITAELTNTGVTPGSYGSSSLIPIVTVDEDGRITSVSTIEVGGDSVADFTYASSNGQLIISTADGSDFVANLDLSAFSTDDLSEGANLYYTVARANTAIDARVTKAFIDALAVDAATLDGANSAFYLDYNNFTNTPVLYTTADANTDIDARVTQSFVDALNVTAAGVQADSVALGTDTTGDYVSGVSGGTGVTVTGGTGEGSTPSIAIGQDVSTTANVTFNDVTVGGTLFSNDVTASEVTITGNLVVNGTTTTVNSTEVNIGDAVLNLNSGLDGATAPSVDGGFSVNRGSSANVALLWDETNDYWTVGSETFVAGSFTGALTGDVTGNVTGDLTGNVTGDLTGNVTGNVTGDLTGDVTGNVTGDLTGDVTGNVTGNADTATALETARTIALSGDVAGSVSFDGTSDVTITAELSDTGVTANTYGSASQIPVITVDVDGRITGVTTQNVSGVTSLSYDSANAEITIATADGSDFNATIDLDAFNTGDLAEGSNLYYTDARARAAISVSGDLAYNSTTGVISFTERTDAEVRGLISVSGDLAYNSTTGVISFTERTDAEVRGLFSAAGDLAYNSTTGQFSVTTYKSTDFDTDFSGKSTTDLTEGDNLYFTDARARAAISVSGDLAYNSTTGVLSVTTYKSADFDTDFSGKSTTDLTEGDNLYYTVARANTAIDARVTQAFVDNLNVTAAGVQANSVALGTDTTGDYVASATGGTGVTITNASGEGSNPTFAIGQDVSTTANVTFQDMTLTGDLQIDGDFTVSGNVVSVNVQELSVEDNLIYLNANAATTNPDLGWAGSYNDGTYAHAGLFRDASDGVFKVFDGYTPEPDESVYIDTTHASFNLANIQAGEFIGALTGDVTGTVSDISNHSTTDLSEGTNLYFTDARARAAISVSGDLAYNSTTGVVSFTERTDAEVKALFSAAGDLSYNSTTGQFSVTTYKSTDFDTDFSGKSTTDLSEGTNLYYTDARARAAISVSGDLAYNSTTGVVSFTERTDAEVRGLFSAAGDLSYNSTTGEFSLTIPVGYDSDDFDTDFASKTTDDLAEGNTSLYYTDTRVRAVLTADSIANTAYVDQAESDANAYTDGRETAITTAYEAYADQAEADAITAANAYTDGRETAITTAYEAYADQAEVDAKAYTDARETAITTAYEAYADQAEVDAKAYTDDRETAITTAYEAYADQAEVDAKAYTDAEITSNVTDKLAAANGIATLDGNGLVPAAQLPSYVDDVLEYADFASFPVSGEAGKIYVDIANSDVYRWSGSAYIIVSDAVSSADQATKLATARTIALSGDVTGSATFDGSANATITAVVGDDSHNHTVSTITDFGSATNTAIDARVTKAFVDALNVNADTLDGQQGSYYLDFTNATNKPDPTVSVALTGDVAGSGSATLTDLANGSISITAELSDTGVVANTYGSASQVPVITVDVDGRITNATSVSVAGVDTFAYDSANAVLTIGTADGGSFDATIDLNAFSTTDLAEGDNLYYTVARANTAIDARVTKAFVDALNVNADTLDGEEGAYYLDFNNATNKPDPTITVSLSGDVAGSASATLTDLANGSIAITATIQENSVALGTDTTGDYVTGVTGGTGVTVTGGTGEGSTPSIEIGQDVSTTANVTFNDVTVDGSLYSNDITASEVTITGNLVVNGTTTTINSTEVNVGDAVMNLNSGLDGATAPANDAGISINRGSSANVSLLWDETNDYWTVGSETFVAASFTGDLTGDVTGNADTATALETSRTIELTGDATGSASFDGTANAVITVEVADDSHNHTNSTGDFEVGGALTVANGGITLTTTSQISGVANPSLDTDAANKKYVDDSIEFSFASDTVLISSNAAQYVATAGQTVFALPEPTDDENHIFVAINGVHQYSNTYVHDALNDTVTLDAGATAGDDIDIRVFTRRDKGIITSFITTDNYTANGTQTAFAASQSIAGDAFAMVFINGIKQFDSTYSTAGSTVTFNTAPTNGDEIEIKVFASDVTDEEGNALGTLVDIASFNGDGTTDSFTFDYNITAGEGAFLISIDGVRQAPSTYSVDSVTNTVTLDAAPTVGQTVELRLVQGVPSGDGIALVSSQALVERSTVIVANTATTIDSFSAVAYRSAKFIIQLSHDDVDFEFSEANVLHDGNAAFISQYGIVNNNGNLGTVDAVVTGGNVNLVVTPNQGNTKVRVIRTSLSV